MERLQEKIDRLWELADERKDEFEDVQYEIQDEIENSLYDDEKWELENEFDEVTQFIDDMQEILYLTDGSEKDSLRAYKEAEKLWDKIPRRFNWE